MDTVLRKERIHITSEHDRVLINIGNLQVDMPYASSFKIAQGLRLASKDAMRYAKEDPHTWSTIAALNDMPEETTPYQVSKKNQVTIRKNYNWAVGYEGENIKIKFGNIIFKFHFVVALKMSEWIRIAGREAKSWAGDGSKSMIAFGILSDAEENYRLGVK